MRATRPSVLAATALLVGLCAGPAGAQVVVPDTYYDAGRVAFDYVQTPFPGYSGSFAVEGEALPPDGQLPPGQTEAVGGGMVAIDADSVRTALYAVTDNGDGTFDFALAALTTVGFPTPGSYPIDLENGTAIFGFVDDAEGFDLPDTLDQDSLLEWFTSLPADHKLISTSGSIELAGADADTLHGTFAGTTVDIDDFFFFVNVSGGTFALSGADAVSAAPAAAVTPRLTAAPNPFNPRTEVRLALPTAATVAVRIYDAAGRHVRTLHEGPLAAGPRRLAWDGLGDRGRRVAAGVYLVEARAAGWREAVKVTLAP
jgi:hypothetical protein